MDFRGRSYGELDILFENKVPAWRFKSTKVDQFASVHEIQKVEQFETKKNNEEGEVAHLDH